MRSAVMITFIGLLVLAALALVPPSAARPGCTQTGTADRDVMAGTRGRDVMCAKGGNDYVHGGAGSDQLRGGAGADTLVGGTGNPDRVRGHGGDDRLFVVDNRPGDKALGGEGFDQCFVDEGDVARDCERVFRGHSITVRQYLALQGSFFGGLSLAEILIAEGPPPVTVTPPPVTVTVTVPFPPCTPPPKDPPPNC